MTVALCSLDAVDAADLLEAVDESRAHMEHVAWAPLVVDLESAARFVGLQGSGIRGIRVDGRFTGLVALQPMEDGRLNFASWVRASEEGKGIAYEAGRLLLATRGSAVVVAPVDPANARSVAYVKRLGFVEGVLPCLG